MMAEFERPPVVPIRRGTRPAERRALNLNMFIIPGCSAAAIMIMPLLWLPLLVKLPVVAAVVPSALVCPPSPVGTRPKPS
eukprot:SAG31_NODE_9859_length_1219_cov_7.760243_1_plen_79_part_10